MDIFFVDDAGQKGPSREGMGELMAIGGLYVPSDAVANLERDINKLCQRYNFPDGEEFKWSPDRNHWMRDNLIDSDREDFFIELLNLIDAAAASAIIVIEDINYETANKGKSHEEDIITLFLERANKLLGNKKTQGIVVVDRPGGGRKEEYKFLASCLETLQTGTLFVDFENIALNVLSTPSKLINLVQVADVITSCTLAYVGGENKYSPKIFEKILPILERMGSTIGGVGLKIHPDYKYCNLYHWLLGDKMIYRLPDTEELPSKKYPYGDSPFKERNEENA